MDRDCINNLCKERRHFGTNWIKKKYLAKKI